MATALTTHELQPGVLGTTDALLPPNPDEIDASIEKYEETKRHHTAAKILLDEEKARLVFLVDSFGSVPAHAEQSRRLEGKLHTLTVTRGTSVAIADSHVLDLHLFLSTLGRSAIFEKLFAIVTKHKLVEGASEYLRTVDLPKRSHQKLLALFGQCISVETNSPSVKVELRKAEKPARKVRAGKAGA